MKELVAVLLLVIAVVLIYESTIGGAGGMGVQARNGGGRVHQSIERLDP